MRISTNQMATDAVANLNAPLLQAQQLSEELSTGLAVNQPSDNPQGAGEIVTYDHQISLDNGYLASSQAASGQLTQASSVLGQVLNVLNSVQTAAVTGSNSATENPADLQALATQVYASLSQLVGLANTQDQGQNLFGGFHVAGPAFTATTNAGGTITGVTYNGDSGVNHVPAGQGVSVAANLPGNQVFDAAGSSVFQSVLAVAQSLASGNQAGISAGLQQLTAAMATVTQAQADAGALTQSLQNQETSLNALTTNLTTDLGQVQNANMAQVATSYQQVLNTYQEGMAAVGQVARLPSLVEYM